MWDTVLFDLDGTLTDSGLGIKRCVQYATKKALGFEETREEVLRSFVGPPLLDSFLKYDGVTREDAERAIAAYRERYKVKGIYENTLYPGVAEMLKAIRAKGCTIALTSSKPELYCRQILGFFHIAEYFDCIVGAPMDESRADKRSMIARTLLQLGKQNDRQSVVMVGDRCFDVEGAHAEGISSVGVRYGYAPAGELERAKPDAIVSSVQELQMYLTEEMQKPADHEGGRVFYKEQEYGRATSGSEKKKQGGVYPCDGSAFHRVLRCVWPALLAIAIELLLGFVFGMIGTMTGAIEENMSGDTGELNMFLTSVMDVCFVIVYGLIYRKDNAVRKGYGAEERLLKQNGYRLLDAVFTVCAMLTVSFFADLLLTLLMREGDAYSRLTEQLREEPFYISVLLTGVLAPFAEECLFRGVLYRRIRDYLGIWWAAVISAAVFGAFHGNLAQGVAAGAMGFVLALLYEHYGTLKASITAHMAVNIFGVVSMRMSSEKQIQTMVGGAVVLLLAAGIVSLVHIFWREDRVNRI